MNNKLENISNVDLAKSILEEYAQPYDNMIDEGNLFFAATEYQKAYEAALAEAVERETVLAEACNQLCESMVPHPKEHPSMFAAKRNGLEALAIYNTKETT